MTFTDFVRTFPGQFEALRASYGEPHRAYHNWMHIEALLAQFRECKSAFEDPDAMMLAILYHDCVYDPLGSGNERASADRMARELRGQLDGRILADAAQLILATEKHVVPGALSAGLSADCALFLDMDLSILGAERATFDQYEAAIREEYRAVPDRLFRDGRKAILGRFLARPEIYFTNRYRLERENQARTNLARAIAALDGA
ncbi:MAG: hypothetical protein OEN23_08770 [Paracoccaceae bacterium]|nr:hypothetical protein [Paracoccaceae bacterium]